MAEYHHIPEGNLASYAEMIWYSDGYVPAGAIERVLPNGACQLIINLGNEKFRHFESTNGKRHSYNCAVISGIHTVAAFLDSYSRISTMGVVLKPGAVSALFGIPAIEFKNDVIPLADVCPVDVSALRQRLIHAVAPKDKFAELDSFLTGRLASEYQSNPAIIYSSRQLDERNGMPSIAEIREKIGYSRRRFSTLFKELVGVTPKQYARICRFQHTLLVIRANDNPDWAALALNCGYYDQSHLIHDFKSLTGLSPTAYHRNQTDAINHLPV